MGLTNGTSFNDAILLTSSYQSEINATLTNRYFAINVEEGVGYSFTTLSDADLIAYLYDSDLKQIGYDDDGGEGRNPLIAFLAPYSGTVYAMVAPYRSGTVIPFEAVISELELVAGDRFESAIEIGTGEGQTLTLLHTQQHTYFKAKLKQGVRYQFESKTNYDVYAHIYGEGKTYIADDDDGGENYNFLVKFFPKSTWTYFEIYCYESLSEGESDIIVDLFESDSSRVEGYLSAIPLKQLKFAIHRYG